MEFSELMAAFMADAGVGDGPVIEDGACHLMIDDRDVGFMEADGGRRLVVWCAVGPCPADRRDAFLILLLRANFMGRMLADGAFSLSDDDIVYAHCTLALPVYDKDVFYRSLRNLLEAVEQWEDMAETYRQAVETKPEGRDSADSRPLGVGCSEGWALDAPGLRV